jgi:alpha-tubulin suppressor-like RCC1 family protein
MVFILSFVKLNRALQLSIPDAALSGVSAIAGGGYHTIALKNGDIFAWGDNSQGQRTILDACEVATVTRVQPISGPSTGGTAVKIIGTNFFSALPVTVI